MKVVLTGHSRGLGAALTQCLVEKGVHVLGLSRGRHPGVGAQYQGYLTEQQIDLADPAALLQWLALPDLKNFLGGHIKAGEPAGQHAGQNMGQQVVLINNAGLLAPIGQIGQQSNAEILSAMTVNVGAALTLTNEFVGLTQSVADRRVLHISSGAARSPYAGWSIYCATKAALDQHAKCLAVESHPGLRICSLAPGIIDTDMQAQVRSTSLEAFPMRKKFDQLKAEGQLALPADTARALLQFLFSTDFGQAPCLDLRSLANH
jgi:benzil reductase ((S)-benzoin forming)